jgi:SPP1 gp7 family putative phage head morphogenesis protein
MLLKYLKFKLKIFREQKVDVLKELNTLLKRRTKAISIDELIAGVLLSKKNEIQKYKLAMTGILTEIFNDSIAVTSSFVGTPLNSSDFSPEKLIKRETTRVATSLTDTTNNALRVHLSEGIAAGESNEQIAKRIEGFFNDSEKKRALTIARTETARYSEKATLEVYKQSDVVVGKEWVTNPGACEFCLSLEGKTYGLDESFAEKNENVVGVDGGTFDNSWDTLDAPPIHPACRCTLAPVFK